MDLSHYDTEQDFDGHQAAALIAGIDPILDFRELASSAAKSRYELAKAQLERDYLSAIESFRRKYTFCVGAYFPFLDTPRYHRMEEEMKHTSGIVSVNMLYHANRIANGYDIRKPNFSKDAALTQGDAPLLPFSVQRFNRRRLDDWCAAREWDSEYTFVDRRVLFQKLSEWEAELERNPKNGGKAARGGNGSETSAAPESLPQSGRWPWGTYETTLLKLLPLAYAEHWQDYDPKKPNTAPKSQVVEDWLVEEFGTARRVAEVIAQLLRADELPNGPRRAAK